MFTGIIRHSGRLLRQKNDTLVLRMPTAWASKLKAGDSIAVNGVCLTVEQVLLPARPAGADRARSIPSAHISIMPETRRVTTLGRLPIGSVLNLELPLTLADRLDGHIVAGHVDGVGVVKKIIRQGHSRVVTISLPATIARLVASKGSIAVDGVSMTVINVTSSAFSIGVIPETVRRTSLGQLKVGDQVNLEADLIARYLFTPSSRTSRSAS